MLIIFSFTLSISFESKKWSNLYRFGISDRKKEAPIWAGGGGLDPQVTSPQRVVELKVTQGAVLG